MSIIYTLGIPASADNPSTDQPNMQSNNDANDAIWLRDHIGFNASGFDRSGIHQQVQFNNNNVPAVPTAYPTLFTNTVAALTSTNNQVFFYSGADAAHTSAQYVVDKTALQGSTFLFGGIILKWGFKTMLGNDAPIAFITPFPNAVFSVVIGPYFGTAAGSSLSVSSTAPPTVAGFNIKTLSGNMGVYYVAIGN